MTLTYRLFLENNYRLDEGIFSKVFKRPKPDDSESKENKINPIGKYIDDMLSAGKISNQSKVFLVLENSAGKIYDEHNERIPVGKIEVNEKNIILDAAVDRNTSEQYASKVSDLSTSLTINDIITEIRNKWNAPSTELFHFLSVENFAASMYPITFSYNNIKSKYGNNSLMQSLFDAYTSNKIANVKRMAIIDAFIGKAPYDEPEDPEPEDPEPEDPEPEDPEPPDPRHPEPPDPRHPEPPAPQPGKPNEDGKSGALASAVKGAATAICGVQGNVVINNYGSGQGSRTLNNTTSNNNLKVIHVIPDITGRIPELRTKYSDEHRTASAIESSSDAIDLMLVDIRNAIASKHGDNSVDLIGRRSSSRSSGTGSSGTRTSRTRRSSNDGSAETTDTRASEHHETSSEVDDTTNESYIYNTLYYDMINEALQYLNEAEEPSDLYLVVSISNETKITNPVGNHTLTVYLPRSRNKDREVSSGDINTNNNKDRRNRGNGGNGGNRRNRGNGSSSGNNDADNDLAFRLAIDTPDDDDALS